MQFLKCMTALLCMCATSALAQIQVPLVASTGNVSLVASATAASLQQPSSNSLPISFPSAGGAAPGVGASIYCSAQCTASIIRNSTAATTTAGTVVNINPTDPVAVVKFFTASNYSGGTTLAVINIGAGSTQSLDMSAIKMGAGGTGVNLTIAIASLTGTVNITFFPLEQH